MIEKLIDTLKIFLEKYFIPTVIAVVLSFITYYKTTVDNSFLLRFGISGFSVFIFCIWFLIIEFVIWTAKRIQKFFRLRDDQKYHMQKRNEEKQKTIELLWTQVDKLSNGDYKLLLKFLKNGNQPYYESEIRFGQNILNSEWVHRTEVEATQQIPITIGGKLQKGTTRLPTYETIPVMHQYVLKKEIYEILKYSLEKYGKISHFLK